MKRLVSLEDVKRFMGCECIYYDDKKQIIDDPPATAEIYRALCPEDKTRAEMWPQVTGRMGDDTDLVVEMVGADGNFGFKFYYPADTEQGQSPLDPPSDDKGEAAS